MGHSRRRFSQLRQLPPETRHLADVPRNVDRPLSEEFFSAPGTLDAWDRAASHQAHCQDGIRAARSASWRCRDTACRATATYRSKFVGVPTVRLNVVTDRRRLDDAAFEAERAQRVR